MYFTRVNASLVAFAAPMTARCSRAAFCEKSSTAFRSLSCMIDRYSGTTLNVCGSPADVSTPLILSASLTLYLPGATSGPGGGVEKGSGSGVVNSTGEGGG